jgi:RNA polymerase sigma factor (sigma-70 family)
MPIGVTTNSCDRSHPHVLWDTLRHGITKGTMFATTRWSLIATAADTSAPQTHEALAELCTLYWQPVYAYFRRQFGQRERAEDLTQAFFARLLETNNLAIASPDRGRFRSFLLTACQHFLANQHDHETALKRGGGRLRLDFASAEQHWKHEPQTSAERLFERRWAMQLLEQALAELREEYRTSDRGSLFESLVPFLSGEAGIRYEELANTLGLTIGAVKVSIHRLRQRYRDRIRDVIGRTVVDPSEIDNEVRDLFAALS